jgi:hypothetical protein
LENQAVPAAHERPAAAGRVGVLATLYDAPDEVISDDEAEGGKSPVAKSKSAPATPLKTPLRWVGLPAVSPAFSTSKPPLSPARPGMLVCLLLAWCHAVRVAAYNVVRCCVLLRKQDRRQRKQLQLLQAAPQPCLSWAADMSVACLVYVRAAV